MPRNLDKYGHKAVRGSSQNSSYPRSSCTEFAGEPAYRRRLQKERVAAMTTSGDGATGWATGLLRRALAGDGDASQAVILLQDAQAGASEEFPHAAKPRQIRP